MSMTATNTTKQSIDENRMDKAIVFTHFTKKYLWKKTVENAHDIAMNVDVCGYFVIFIKGSEWSRHA